MIEHEVAFVFTPPAFNAFCRVAALNIDKKEVKIVDCYFDTGLRVRQAERCGGSSDYALVEKTGKKSEGSRVELSSPISREAAEILSRQTKLMVIKDRCRLYGKLADGYVATVDYVSTPMSLAIMEIESEDGRPVNPNLVNTLLEKYHLQVCPLSAWQLFKRKIGICGAPSSGKSETAKYISNTLNTKYSSNSFNVVEYATSFIQKYGRTPGFEDAFLVWYGQHEREKDARTSDIVISDCPTFLAYIYMKFHRPPKFDAASALSMAKMYKRALTDVQTYTDLIFLEMADYRENGVRYQNRNEAERIQSMIYAFLSEHNIPFIMSDCRKSDELLRKLFYINSQVTY